MLTEEEHVAVICEQIERSLARRLTPSDREIVATCASLPLLALVAIRDELKPQTVKDLYRIFHHLDDFTIDVPDAH